MISFSFLPLWVLVWSCSPSGVALSLCDGESSRGRGRRGSGEGVWPLAHSLLRLTLRRPGGREKHVGKTVLIRLWLGLKNCGRDGGLWEHWGQKKKKSLKKKLCSWPGRRVASALLCSSAWLATGTALSAPARERWRETFSSLHKSTRFSRRCEALIRSEVFRGSDPDGVPVAEVKGRD